MSFQCLVLIKYMNMLFLLTTPITRVHGWLRILKKILSATKTGRLSSDKLNVLRREALDIFFYDI